jgi:hypothetical protein
MSIFNIHKNKAICVLPWVHEHLDTTGNQKPCCHGKVFKNNRTLKNIREEMLIGTQPIECQECYTQEANKESSARIRITIDWVKKFGYPDVNNYRVQYLDIRNNPTCNLKCKTCGPHSSTLWAKEKKLSVTIPNYNLQKYNKQDLKKVYLAGGEPTYNKSYLEFLQELLIVNPSCEVIINTNCKSLPNAWKEVIGAFQNLTVIISCDAIEDLGCYVRYPLEWKKFEDNVKFISEQANFTMFNLVASNLTIHKIDHTVEWMSNYSNNISIMPVRGDRWRHFAVPHEHRTPYIESLKNILKFPVSNWQAYQFRMNIDSLINQYQSNNYDPLLHQKLKHEIAEQDSHRTTHLRDVDPFLYSWILDK